MNLGTQCERTVGARAQRVSILGVAIDGLSMEAALGSLEAFIRQGGEAAPKTVPGPGSTSASGPAPVADPVPGPGPTAGAAPTPALNPTAGAEAEPRPGPGAAADPASDPDAPHDPVPGAGPCAATQVSADPTTDPAADRAADPASDPDAPHDPVPGAGPSAGPRAATQVSADPTTDPAADPGPQLRRTVHVVTANPEIVMEARRRPEFAAVLREAELVLPDGIGIVWAARLLGRPVVERVPGIELTEALLAAAARHGYKVFFLGAERGVAEQAAAEVERVHPGIRVVGTHHGYFSSDEEADVVDQVRRAEPDVLFVGLGAPRQELFIARHRTSWNVPVAIGVGGSLDVLSGRARRAPRWVQAMGLEWLYRLVREPRRIGRAVSLPQFAVLVLLDAMRRNLL